MYLLIKDNKVIAISQQPFIGNYEEIDDNLIPIDFNTKAKPIRHWNYIDGALSYDNDSHTSEVTIETELLEIETLKGELTKEMFDIHIGLAINQNQEKKDRYLELATKYNKL